MSEPGPICASPGIRARILVLAIGTAWADNIPLQPFAINHRGAEEGGISPDLNLNVGRTHNERDSVPD